MNPSLFRRGGQLCTQLQNVALRGQSDFRTPPNPAKQRTAFPPNYVHSLDSTHMMYTALACQADSTLNS